MSVISINRLAVTPGIMVLWLLVHLAYRFHARASETSLYESSIYEDPLLNRRSFSFKPGCMYDVL